MVQVTPTVCPPLPTHPRPEWSQGEPSKGAHSGRERGVYRRALPGLREAAVRTASGLVSLRAPGDLAGAGGEMSQPCLPPRSPYPELLEKMNQSDSVLIGPGLEEAAPRTCAPAIWWRRSPLRWSGCRRA